jgi:hypothetical protein
MEYWPVLHALPMRSAFRLIFVYRTVRTREERQMPLCYEQYCELSQSDQTVQQ